MGQLGDDRIGRALDRLFDADRAALLTEVVLSVGRNFAVHFAELHNDSTSVRFCGQYRGANAHSIRGRTAPAIIYGYSKYVAATLMFGSHCIALMPRGLTSKLAT
jgi:hypothetical protein